MKINIEHIEYHIERRGNGFPILCLHGFAEDQSTWDCLELKGYELILVDSIGHGQTSNPEELQWYSLEKVLSHLHQLVERLELGPYGILGYSMGGRIGLAYGLTYPYEVEFLIVEGASYGEVGEEKRSLRRKQDHELAEKIEQLGIEWFCQYWEKLSIFNTQENLPEVVRERIRQRRANNTPSALAHTLRQTGQGQMPAIKNRLKELTMPVLYLSGEWDTKYSKMGQEFAQENNRITHQVIPRCGHNVHIEQPNYFNEAIQQYLNHIKGWQHE